MKVGIVGGGQLGLMLAESLARCGAVVAVFDPDPKAPARRAVGRGVRHEELFTCASFSDHIALSAFISSVDVVTYEFEAIDLEVLKRSAAQTGTRIVPDPKILGICRSRIAEREFVQSQSLPCSPFRAASNLEEVEAAFTDLGFPVVIKTDRGGYDGKGQWLIENRQNWLEVQKEISGYLIGQRVPGGQAALLLVEKKVELLGEFSCIAARGPDGTLVSFPVFENVHRDHILDETYLPARLPSELINAARDMARASAEALELEGLLTTEFFYGRVGNQKEPVLLVNEFAPRPHNSGHITRRATTLSQFDLLAMILVGLPPVTPSLLPLGFGESFRMKNLLGRDMESVGGRDACSSLWLSQPGTLEYYDYGKSELRELRKMGHVLGVMRRGEH